MAGRTILFLLLGASLSLAQQKTTSFRAGTVHLLQGRVSIDGKRVILMGGVQPPAQMHNGQRMHVDRGRVEIWLGPGAALTMTSGSTLYMQENALTDVQLVLEQGSALVKVNQTYEGGRLRVMLPNGAVEMPRTGWYHFDANPLQLRVYKGSADVEAGDSVAKVKKGEAVDLALTASSPARFNLKAPDPLIAWETQRIQEEEARERRFNERTGLLRARTGLRLDEQKQVNQDRQRAQQPNAAISAPTPGPASGSTPAPASPPSPAQ